MSTSKLRKPISHVILAVFLVCGSLGRAAERLRLEVPVFEGGEGLDFFLDCARAYEKVRPDVRVDLYGDPRMADKMRIRVLEGTYPEICNANLNYWSLIRSGDMQPMDAYLDGPNWEGDGTWRESFMPGSLDRYTHEGKVYGIPFSYSVYCCWYNRVLFETHGWSPPVTWPEFFALCDRIKAAGIAPLAFQGRYPDYAQCLIGSAYYHQAGRQGYADQLNLEPGSFDNPALVKALGIAQKTAMEYFQPGAMGMSHTEAQLQFFLGNTAMIFCGSWLKSEMLGKIPDGFRLGEFNLPIVPGGQADLTSLYADSTPYFVFANCRYPAEAANFLRFMTSRRMAGIFARQRDVPVAVAGANEGNLSADLADLAAMVDRARTTYGTIQGEGFPEMNQYWNDARFNLLTGKSTPAETAAFLEESAAAVRNRAANPDHVTVRHRWKPTVLLGLLALACAYTLLTAARRLRDARREGPPIAAGRTGLSWWNVLLFVGPAALLYTIFVVVPSAKSFAWSVHAWDGLTDMTFKGLLHFRRLLFESDGFWIALQNNLFVMFVIPAFVLPLSLFFATCISSGVRGASVFRVVFFFPNILGVVAATLLWMHMYNPQGGVVNGALVALGFESFNGFAWLSQDFLYWALIPMSVWGACGFNMLLFLAAMEGIPRTLYEAAELDGITPWNQFWHITVPLIWDVLSIAVVFMVIGGMKAFEVIWLLTNQNPATRSHVIGTRMVQTMFTEFRVGEATAIAVLLFLMVFFGTTTTLRAMKREAVEY